MSWNGSFGSLGAFVKREREANEIKGYSSVTGTIAKSVGDRLVYSGQTKYMELRTERLIRKREKLQENCDYLPQLDLAGEADEIVRSFISLFISE